MSAASRMKLILCQSICVSLELNKGQLEVLVEKVCVTGFSGNCWSEYMHCMFMKRRVSVNSRFKSLRKMQDKALTNHLRDRMT
mmetsp:Transcript_12672/g.36391  ORF Transcript_12672/g.36391 Transcript_12672/m.36391 type:complete len:83 (-) Transcript_12672:30-278(-)